MSTLLVDRLRSVLKPESLLTSASDLMVYECDGYTIEKNKPDVVAFPTSTEQVAEHRQDLPGTRRRRFCRAEPGRAWPAAVCRSAAAS